MSFLAVHYQDRTANFVCIRQDGHIDERKRRCDIPAQAGVNGAGMITALSLVIIIIVLQELWRVIGRFWVRYATFICTVAIIFSTLGIHLPAHFVAGIGIVVGIEITFGGSPANVVHRGSYRCLDACVHRCRIDGKSAETANAENADTLRIHIVTCSKIIHRRTEIFRIDVGRSYAARLSTALTSKRWVKGNGQETTLCQCLGIQPR